MRASASSTIAPNFSHAGMQDPRDTHDGRGTSRARIRPSPPPPPPSCTQSKRGSVCRVQNPESSDPSPDKTQTPCHLHRSPEGRCWPVEIQYDPDHGETGEAGRSKLQLHGPWPWPCSMFHTPCVPALARLLAVHPVQRERVAAFRCSKRLRQTACNDLRWEALGNAVCCVLRNVYLPLCPGHTQAPPPSSEKGEAQVEQERGLDCGGNKEKKTRMGSFSRCCAAAVGQAGHASKHANKVASPWN